MGLDFTFLALGGAFVFCCLVGVTFPLLVTEVSLPEDVDLGVLFVFCCRVGVAFSLLLTEVSLSEDVDFEGVPVFSCRVGVTFSLLVTEVSSREVEGVCLKTFPFSVVDVVVVPLTFLTASGGARFISLGSVLVSAFDGML